MTNLYLQSISLVYMVMISIIYFSKKTVKSYETKLFEFMSYINIIGIVLDIIIVYLSYKRPGIDLLIMLNKIYLFYIVLWISLLVTYFVCSIYKREKYIKAYTVSLIVSLLLVFYSIIILPIELINDKNIMYTSGLSVSLTFLYGSFLVFFLSIIIATNFKKLNKKKNRFLGVIIGILFLGIICRILDPSILITTTLITLINIFMYFTIENPDLKYIDTLSKAKIAVEKSNNAKTEFISSMSHEIRTPLNAIIGFCDCILEEEDLKIIKEDANDISIASETLLEIVNGILDISKIEANKMEVINTDYDLVYNMENISKLILPRISKKEIDFEYSFSDTIPGVLNGDIGKIKQIMSNILSNAAKYTESGKIIFNISCINEEEYATLIFSVKDTGRGMKKNQIDKLFDKFSRLEEDKNGTIEGTGLGLAITKSLTELIDGKILVNSVYGEGSEFTVQIKQKIISIEKQELEEIKTIKKDNKIKYNNYNILIVDDNNLNLKIETKILSKFNIVPTCVTSGEDCINKVKTEEYDLILLDDVMPDLSGKDTLIELQKIDGFQTPVIALTANTLFGIREKYISMGFTDYLSKPININLIAEILEKYKPKPKKDIVIVDDNITNIKIATRFLSKIEANIFSFDSGEKCIEFLKDKEVDLVILDDMMPNLTGTETLKKLKTEYNYTKPIIVLTANAIDGAKEMYLKAGFDEYLSKPIDQEKFLRIVKKYLKYDIDINEENKELINEDYFKENDIDIKTALTYLGDMDMYNETIRHFLDLSENRLEKILNYSKSDIENYLVEVHSLKSDCKYLGFNKLSDISKEHEAKAKENNNKYIEENIIELKSEYKRIIDLCIEYCDRNEI